MRVTSSSGMNMLCSGGKWCDGKMETMGSSKDIFDKPHRVPMFLHRPKT